MRINPGSWTTGRLREFVAMSSTLLDGITLDTKESLFNTARVEAAWQVKALRSYVPLSVSLSSPSVEKLRALSNNTVFKGDVMSAWWSRLRGTTQKKIYTTLSQGMAGGETVDKLVRRLRDDVFGADAFVEHSARAIVRTSINTVSSMAREETFKANSDILSGVQIVATLDTRTTEICMAYDGQVFNVGEGPRPPFHWNCRTTVIPVTKSWKELGIDREEPASTRASMNGQVADRLTYGEWLESQSEKTQIMALGKKRAELFRAGKITVDRFVEQGRVLTLTELSSQEI